MIATSTTTTTASQPSEFIPSLLYYSGWRKHRTTTMMMIRTSNCCLTCLYNTLIHDGSEKEQPQQEPSKHGRIFYFQHLFAVSLSLCLMV
mmetsp:Transcript_13135/g.20476  ORF Transcript_13135/g.20476 Transcript_13135/m.20476 type:complete len:90 (-) Transcript_13135:130-399(-)